MWYLTAAGGSVLGPIVFGVGLSLNEERDAGKLAWVAALPVPVLTLLVTLRHLWRGDPRTESTLVYGDDPDPYLDRYVGDDEPGE